jgi:iron complex outermembrane receptor protein
MCLFVFPQISLAQSSEEDLALAFDEEMVSIATGGEQSLSRAPAVATVITAKDIEAMGAQKLDQVLESVPGLHVSLSPVRFSPIYSIRGIYTTANPQVLMLINGIPMTQMWIGDRGFGGFPVADVSRIEVIRGPGSAVYGADAFSGVINIVTKSAKEKSGVQINALTGSFDTTQASILYGSKDNEYWGFDIGFSMEYFETKGDKDRIIEQDAQTSLDPLAEFVTGKKASLAPGPVDTRAKWLDTRLDLKHDKMQFRIWNWQRKDLGVGPGLAQSLDPTGRGDANNYLIDLTYHNPSLTRNIDFKTVASYMDINTTSQQRLFPAGTVLPIGQDGNVDPASTDFVLFTDGVRGNPSIFEAHTRLDLNFFYTGIEKHRLRIGTGLLNAKARGEETKNFGPGVLEDPASNNVVDGTLTDVSGTPYAFFTSAERDVYYLSLQDEWYLAPDWDLTVGLRYDDYSDFGNTVNPRLALVWHPEYNMTTKLLYGRAFRPPSFVELFAKNNPAALGNSELNPETIETVELVLNYQPTFDLSTALNTFYYEIDDLIEYVVTTGTTRVAQNIGNRKGYGLEWETTWKITPSWNLSGNYAFQRSIDKTTDSDVANTPQHQIYLDNRWEFMPQWHFNAILNWVAERKRAKNDLRPPMEDYTLVDFVVLGQDILQGLDIKLSVFNAFDEKAYEPSPDGTFIPGDYPLAGRNFYIGLNYQF